MLRLRFEEAVVQGRIRVHRQTLRADEGQGLSCFKPVLVLDT